MKTLENNITISHILAEVFHEDKILWGGAYNYKSNLEINSKENIELFIIQTLKDEQIEELFVTCDNIHDDTNVLVYLITPQRFIKILIEKNGEISCNSYLWSELCEVRRKSIIDITFQNDNFVEETEQFVATHVNDRSYLLEYDGMASYEKKHEFSKKILMKVHGRDCFRRLLRMGLM
jgi:hypothetical protein